MVLADSTRARPRRTEQDRRRLRPRRQLPDRDPLVERRPEPGLTRHEHPNNREPRQSRRGQQQIRARRRMASPGPAPPCEQAAHGGAGPGGNPNAAHGARRRRERVTHPALCQPSFGVATALVWNERFGRTSAEDRPRWACAHLSLSFRLWI